MTKLTQSRVDAIKTWFVSSQSATDQRFKDFVKAIAHGIEGHGHRFTGGPGDTAGDAAGAANIQAGTYAERPSYPKQGDLYIATDQRALYGCLKHGQWTMIGTCYAGTPMVYNAYGGGVPECIRFHTGIPPDTDVFCTSFPDTWSNLQHPRVVRTDDTRYVVWRAYHSILKQSKVLFSASFDRGLTFSAPFWVSDLTEYPTYDHRNPDLAVDMYGFIHLTWRARYSGEQAILFYSKSLTQGETWTTPIEIEQAVYRPPRIAVHGGGQYINVLMKTVAGNMYVDRSEDFGNTFPYQVSIPAGGNPYSTGAEYDLRFVGNLLYGASTDTDRLYLFRSPDYGVTWLVLPRQPSGTIEGNYMPLAIAARENKLWVVYPYWIDEDQYFSVIDCYFTLDDFETWNYARAFGPVEEWPQDPSIELYGSKLHTVWRPSGKKDIYRCLSSDEGFTWSDRTIIVTTPGYQNPEDPIVADFYPTA